jgi:hypothetical protein
MWKGYDFKYSVFVLRAIAHYYGHESIRTEEKSSKESEYPDLVLCIEPFAVAEYKVDFDRALNAIGRYHNWEGLATEGDETLVDGTINWKVYHKYGDYQRLVLADVLGVEDRELETRCKFDNREIDPLKGQAYAAMARYLNEGF